MEKLILFLIVFGIGSLFEYLKQKREQRANKSVSPKPSPAEILEREAPVHVQPRQQAKPKPQRQPQAQARPQRPMQPTVSPINRSVPNATPVEPPTRHPDQEGPAINNRQSDQALSEHYERWRRAIIDTEILRPKF